MNYPIGIQSFSEIRNGNFVYVDKTALVYNLVTEGKVYFLSRPRRFGKSLLVSTLEAYFSGRKELFEGLAIDRLEQKWAEHPVFHLDFSRGDFREEGKLKEKIENFLAEKEQIYGHKEYDKSISDRFAGIIKAAHQKTGRQTVVLVDEYDKPLLDVLDDDGCRTDDGRGLEDRNRELLKELYSTFKSCDADLKFILLTGVTKFSQVSIFSGFNQPNDISLDKKYESLCGITQDELKHYFAEPIAIMAANRNISAETMRQLLKEQYDGYHFGPKMVDIFNPFSLLNALQKDDLRDYWFSTGTPTYLLRLLQSSPVNIQQYIDRPHNTGEFADYRANQESLLPMLYQSGYLTIKSYDMEYNEYMLDFPNKEVRRGFLICLSDDFYRKPDLNSTYWLSSSVRMLRRGDIETFLTQMKALLSGIPYPMHTEDKERFFQYTFYLMLRLLGSDLPSVELCTSEGRIDLTYETKDYIYIFEFKRDGRASGAMQQIEDKHYADRYVTDHRKVVKVGANFSSKTWSLDEWIVK